jgi:transposase
MVPLQRLGFDLAKHVFQVHCIDATEKVAVRKQLRRSQVMAFFEALPLERATMSQKSSLPQPTRSVS